MKKGLWLVAVFCLVAPVVVQADDWLARFERDCRAKGGTPVHYSTGGGKCVLPNATAAASSTTTSANPYDPMVDQLLKWIFSPNSNAAAAKQRREAMKRELEAQREQARRNQQQAQAAQLDAILQRLMGDSELILKGMNTDGSDGLKLKLGEKRPLGMEVYQHPNDGKPRMGISGLSGINLDNETPTTTKAQLTLKMGDDATRSLQTPPASPPNAISAPTEAATVPAESTAVEQKEARAQVDEVARLISKLSPEEQQRLLASLRASDASAPAPAQEPALSAANQSLSLKLSGAQAEAGALKAAADSNASPEQLKQQASDQFQNLHQVSITPAANASESAPRPLDTPPPPNPTETARPTSTSAVDCSKPSTTDSSVVDLRCASDKPAVGPRGVQPADRSASATIQAPEAKDLKLLFFKESRWPGPRNPDEPLRNPLRDEELRKVEAEFARRNAQRAVSILYAVVMAGKATDSDREQIASHLLPLPLHMRYSTNLDFKRIVDQKIDGVIAEVKSEWAKQDLEALDDAGKQILPILQRRYPNGLPSDRALDDPEFLAEREKIQAALDQRMLENAQAAPVQVLVRLDLAFMGLR